MNLTNSGTWLIDLNPALGTNAKHKANAFDVLAMMFFLLAAAMLPFKPQPALAGFALCCVFSLFGTQSRYLVKHIRQSPISIVALLLYGAVLISYTYSIASAEQKIKFIFAYRELILLPFLLAFLNPFHSTKQRAAMIFFGLTCFVVGLSIVNFFAIRWHIKPLFDVPSNDNFIFHSHIIQNVMVSLTVLFSMLQAKGSLFLSVRWCVFVVIAALGMIDLFFMVQGRTGQMTMLACGLLFAWFSFTKRSKLIALVVLTLCVTVLFFTKNAFRGTVERTQNEMQVYQQTGESTSAGARVEFWKYALSHIKQAPLLGHGAGSFREEYAQHIQQNNQPGFSAGTHHPHNEFLLLWHDAGLLALLLYVALLASLAWQAHTAENPATKTMRYGIVVSLIIYSLVDVPIFNSAEALFFVLMIVCFFQLNSQQSRLNTN
jgi:O-antigen ligase